MEVTVGKRMEGMKKIEKKKIKIFQKALIKWYKKNKRNFPWRRTKDFYKILLAEVLLQKTKAEMVEPIFLKIIKKYPNFRKLAEADPEELKEIVKPIGLYNQKSKRLISIAKRIAKNGIPTKKELENFPGIGIYVANAIKAFYFNIPSPVVDTNVRRVVSRVFSIGVKKDVRRDKDVWKLVSQLVPKKDHKKFLWALLDLGALVCTSNSPNCKLCPLSSICERKNSFKQRL